MNEANIPKAVQERFGSKVTFEEGQEVRMGWYSDGTLSVDSFSVVISGPFAESPDGRYVAGTRQFGTVAVLVDLIGKQEGSYVSGNDRVQVRDYQNGAFRYEHWAPEGGYEPAPDLLSLKPDNAFAPHPTDMGVSGFIKLGLSKNDKRME